MTDQTAEIQIQTIVPPPVVVGSARNLAGPPSAAPVNVVAMVAKLPTILTATHPAINQVVGGQFQNDALVSSGKDAVIYQDDLSWRGVLALSRCNESFLNVLAQRIQLMRMAECRHLAQVQSVDFDRTPASLRIGPMRNGSPRPMASFQSSVDHANRIALAAQLIDMVAKTHRVGLIHGNLSINSIHIVEQATQSTNDESTETSPQLWVDYTGLDYGFEHSDVMRSTASQCMDQAAVDVAALAPILRVWLAPLLDDGDTDVITGRSRARLKQFLRSNDSDRTLWQWIELFSPWIEQIVAKCPHEIDVKNFGDHADLGGATAEIQLDRIVSSDQSIGNQSNTPSDCTPSINQPKKSGSLPASTILGRYRLEDLIGTGGMGHVYRGVDQVTGETLAIKVLKSGPDMEQAVRRFRKEARLLAEVQNAWITQLHHVGFQRGPGFEDGRHFMVMEWVDGITLSEFMADRKEPLGEQESLSLIADLARALVDAHRCGIVHRDIKPENILLQRRHDISSSTIGINQFSLKLSDFGIARHVDQSKSLEVTRAGTMLGTPRYMSPEQCKGNDEISPAADVYAMGVTLFELVTGQVPFKSDDPMRLAAMHCFDPVPPVARLAPATSESTIRMINRAMAKSVGDRYADAEDWLAELNRIRGRGVIDIETHPQLPVHDAAKVWHKSKVWNLKSRPEELWPMVSNTDRVNRAVGLPAVKYTSEVDPVIGLRKFGSFKIGGMSVSWEEHPFEWIHNRRMGILREFSSGPMKWFMSVVTLEPDGERGTRLTHDVKIESHNLVGRMLATIEADWKGFSKLDKLYRRLDDAIAAGNEVDGIGGDAFENVATLSTAMQARLDRSLDQMATAGVDVEAAAAIVEYIRTAAPQPLSQIRPIALAAGFGMNAHDVVDACLVGASIGLLKFRWEIICPTCRVAAQATDHLSTIRTHTDCSACDTEFRSDIATAIELVFQPHPEIRSVDEAAYCIGGPEHSPHVVAQVRLAAGESLQLPVNLTRGQYKIRSTRTAGEGLDFRVEDGVSRSAIDVDITSFSARNVDSAILLRQGHLRVRLCNPSDVPHVVRLERSLSRQDCLTASSVASLSRFRNCFPDQTLSPDNAVCQGPMTLVCTAASDIENYCKQWGESGAHSRLRQWHQRVAEIAAKHHGVVAKSIDHRQLMVFESVDDAMATVAILTNLEDTQWPKASIVIHRGDTLIATANDRLDYCGAAIRLIMKMTHDGSPGVEMTEAIYADPVVAKRYADWLQTFKCNARGPTKLWHLAQPCPKSLIADL